jgi:predicted acylesterase/phospholipase RssA
MVSVGRPGGRRVILTIDGGGIRGIIPATLLVALEGATGRPARESFSFVAGTSTGAIIAAGVAAGIPATRILDIYIKRAREVFPQSLLKLPRRVITGSMYSTARLNRILVQELGTAGTWKLNDAPIDVLLTAKRLADGMPWYFVKDNPKNSGRTGSLRLSDCATASAAAPTYLQPWPIPSVGELVDGGVGVAGNPVYQACVEAFDYAEGYVPADTIVVSLGTGRYTARNRPAWLWSWLEWILGEMLRSPGEQQTEIVSRHYPDLLFYRIDPKLPRAVGLDDVNSVTLLHQFGRRLAAHVDWPAILAGTAVEFRIGGGNTLWQQYAPELT